MRCPSLVSWVFFASAWSSAAVALPPSPETGWFATAGDLRISVARNNRRERDGTSTGSSIPLLRVRQGAGYRFSSHWALYGRVALLVNQHTDQIAYHFDDTITPGNLTLDNLYLAFTPRNGVELKLGRFQTAYELNSVIQDSLSRHDSSGTSVDWTNGASLTLGMNYKLHYIAQWNHRSGPGNGVADHPLLDYRHGGSRLMHYLALELPGRHGWSQLIADISVIPDVLPSFTSIDVGQHDLVASTLRMARDVPLHGRVIFHPSLELGYQRRTPSRISLGLPGGNEASGHWGIVAGFDLQHVGPGNLGLQIARVEEGYLLSPDYPANASSIELRYTWQTSPRQKWDIRYRLREDISRLAAQPIERVDHNLLLRYSLQFGSN
ncbi:MAG: hypothetical protein WD772_09220 [Pseudohongiellaceae bacterium]